MKYDNHKTTSRYVIREYTHIHVSQYIMFHTCLYRKRDELGKQLNRCLSDVSTGYLGPMILLSYPHGRKLYLSIGKITEEDGQGVDHAVMYQSVTCNGCSGGLVIQIGRQTFDDGFR